jgi:hypothetical protein
MKKAIIHTHINDHSGKWSGYLEWEDNGGRAYPNKLGIHGFATRSTVMRRLRQLAKQLNIEVIEVI